VILSLLIAAAATAATHHAPDPQISGKWILDVIPVLATALAGIITAIIGAPILKKKWKEEALKEASVTIKGQPIQIQNTPAIVTFNDLKPLTDRMDRFESDLKEVSDDQAKQFVKILETGHERENRIIDKMNEMARDWHHRLDLQFGPKPRTPRGS